MCRGDHPQRWEVGTWARLKKCMSSWSEAKDPRCIAEHSSAVGHGGCILRRRSGSLNMTWTGRQRDRGYHPCPWGRLASLAEGSWDA
jgi:hypothetical protein